MKKTTTNTFLLIFIAIISITSNAKAQTYDWNGEIINKWTRVFALSSGFAVIDITKTDGNGLYKIASVDSGGGVTSTTSRYVEFKDAITISVSDVSLSAISEVAYYSINGEKLSQEPSAGVYLVRYSNGVVKKM